MNIRKHTIQHRLQQWAQWTQEPRRLFGRSSSPFGKIAEMQENAGVHVEGIRYELITVDGVTVSCPPDGGMWSEVERQGSAMAHDMRCREVESAVADLPLDHRMAIVHTFVVTRREKPRTTRAVGDLMDCSHKHVQKLLREAYVRVSYRVYGPFEVIGNDADDDEDEEAAQSEPGPTTEMQVA